MPGVADLQRAVTMEPPAHQGGVGAGRRGGGEQPVGAGQHFGEGQVQGGQAAEGRLQVGHQHGGGDALAGHVAQDEEQVPVAADEVAVVTADHRQGAVLQVELPAVPHQRPGRQQRGLDGRRELEVVLEETPLLGRHAVQTHVHQRIRSQAVPFDRAVADLAAAEAPAFDSCERRVHLAQETVHLGDLPSADGSAQTTTPLQELVSHELGSGTHRVARRWVAGHWEPPRAHNRSSTAGRLACRAWCSWTAASAATGPGATGRAAPADSPTRSRPHLVGSAGVQGKSFTPTPRDCHVDEAGVGAR